nr:ASCH domain-containing protein [uncultured Rhodopila sp.]
MSTIPALTIWQPWATLIAEGLKPYEFRGWAAPAALVGQRIAIHAGARPVRKAEVRDLLLRLHSLSWRESGLVREGSLVLLDLVLTAPGLLPLSSVLCTAVLGQPIRDNDLAERLGLPAVNDSDRSEHSSWGWPLTDIVRLEPFVPAKGAQGFWQWTPPGG